MKPTFKTVVFVLIVLHMNTKSGNVGLHFALTTLNCFFYISNVASYFPIKRCLSGLSYA